MSSTKPQGWTGLVWSWLLIALGVLLAERTSEGIYVDNATSLVLGVLFISLLNVFLRPILLLLTLPFVILTLGLGIIVINALVFWIAGSIVPGFHVEGFWSALWGAIVVGLISMLANAFFGGGKVKVKVERGGGGPRDKKGKDDDVIDV